MINKFWIKEEQQNQQRNLGRFFVENAQSTQNNPRQFYAVISALKMFLRPKKTSIWWVQAQQKIIYLRTNRNDKFVIYA